MIFSAWKFLEHTVLDLLDQLGRGLNLLDTAAILTGLARLELSNDALDVLIACDRVDEVLKLGLVGAGALGICVAWHIRRV